MEVRSEHRQLFTLKVKKYWLSRRRTVARSKALAGYTFVSASILLFVLFVWLPIGVGLWLSFHDYRVFTPPRWVGFDNYLQVFEDPLFRTALWNTTYFTVIRTIIVLAMSLPLALFLDRKFLGRGFVRASLYLPVILPVVSMSLTWKYLYSAGRTGVFNYVLRVFGIPAQNWLTDPSLAMPSIIAMSVWSTVGFYTLIYLAGLQGIPNTYYEAAAIDGATPWQQFRYITVPLLIPVTAFVLVMLVISSFQVFSQVYVMTEGGPMDRTVTLVYLIYRTGIENVRMGLASAQGMVLFFILAVLSFVNLRLLRGGEQL